MSLPTLAQLKLILAAIALTALLCFPVGYVKGRAAANRQHAAELALANKLAQDRAITTADKAATERVVDAITVAKREVELTDAIADVPDTAPDAVRVQLGCRRLLAQGTAPADLPPGC